MDRVHERKHEHMGGLIMATVTEHEDGSCDAAVRCYLPDGRELVNAVGAHRNLKAAQRDADERVALMGHECSALCDQWQAVRYTLRQGT